MHRDTRSTIANDGITKILHICATDITLKFLLLNQLLYFKERGFEVAAACSKEAWFLSLGDTGLRLHPVRITRYVSLFADLAALLRLILLLLKEKPDIVHTHTPKAALLGLAAAWVCRVPVRLNTIHGFRFTDATRGVRKLILVALEKVSVFYAHHTLCQNPIDTDMAIRLKIVSAEQITTIGNGVDTLRFSPHRFTRHQKETLRAELGIGSEEFVVGIVARLVEEKGYLELAQAFREFHRGRQARLLIVGEPDLTKRDVLTVEKIAAGIPKQRVLHIPFTEEIPSYMSIMDVFVLPSYREGFPRSVIEAAAMGIPAIAARSNGAQAAIEHEKTGFLVPIRDFKEIVKYLILLFSNTTYRKDIGRQAREKAERDFDETQVFQRIMNVYSRYLSRA